MKTLKNSIILFLAMFAIGWIGFNIVKDNLERKAVSTDTPATNPVSDDLNVSTLNVSASSAPVADIRQGGGGGGAEQQVKSMLKNRADAWNNRNLSRYMADYRKFDSLRVSINGETEKGWQEVYDFFAPKFGPGMGTMRLSNMKIHMVGEFASIVTADWNLQQESRITNGRMNLVMKKIDTAWKITTENLTER